MSVALFVQDKSFPVGSADFLHSFFSTISYRLEESWGARFPVMMSQLYAGAVSYELLDKLEEELKTARRELEGFAPSEVIWDIEDLSKRPPWGNNIADSITSLANYFTTALDSEDLFDFLFRVIRYAKKKKSSIEIH
jgi:hypothetical protein